MSSKQKFLNYLLSFGSIVLLNYLEVITTLIGLSEGLREGNSFIASILSNYGIVGFVLVKAIAMFLVFFSVSKYKFNFIFIYVLYSFIVLHNINLSYSPPVGYTALFSILLLVLFMFILKNNTFFGKNYKGCGVKIPLHTCRICGASRPHIPKSPGAYKGFAIPVEYQRASGKELCIECYRVIIKVESSNIVKDSSLEAESTYSFNTITVKNNEATNVNKR